MLKRSRLLIPIGFGLVLIAILAIVVGLVRAQHAERTVTHTFEVQQAAQALIIEIRDAEASKRSYLLTGDYEYLRAFDAALAAIPAGFEELHELTADNPVQKARMAALVGAADAKIEEFSLTRDMIQRGQRDTALNIINSQESRALTQDIRQGLTAILAAERNLLVERQRRARNVRYLLAGLIGFALVLATALAALLAVATRQALSDLVQRTSELEAESRMRAEAEDTLRQAQKMESVGQLTGGMAHDFNNLLTIIIGNLDTVKRQLTGTAKSENANPLAAKLMKPVDAAMQGARSAAQLTQRLLAFSRRQALEPARVDFNQLIAGMLDMIRRTLGENISIETVYGAGLWPAFADPHQLENLLLNLALNAKDAMPEGGCLTIETANTYLDEAYARRFGDVEAGQYAVLCVTDTGMGIPPNIIDLVFEPFFTTKPRGEGSGLGLAMVHGFVKQSGGHVRIYSEAGKGTTVKVYLPRMTGAEVRPAAPAGKDETSSVPRAEPHETILLVEDNDGVRDFAKGVLQSLGYTVLEARHAAEALRLLKGKPTIHLLFTDVVLPETNGRELADTIREKYPGLPVLFTTGYTRNAIVHQGRLDPDVQLLNKPYTHQDLASKVREMLDRE
ncbi:MAG: CHASE3 domain-containing protein [Methyloceanibacter sp.]|uniref:CHASE3 domain-containing protein n=1 Tax=Methyloceanibacter sp. TaxID=1965321 RepID=UPI003D6D7944